VRVYDLPTGFRTKNIGRQIGNKIGQFLMVDLEDEKSGWRDYLRMRIKIDVEKPLTRIVYVSMGENRKRLSFRIGYEKLPKFCAVCGLMGHSDTECGDGVHDKEAYQYGDWLIASPERKGRIKGNRSSSSADTRGSDSKEFDKSLTPKTSIEHRSGNVNQIGFAGDNSELKDDARSPPEIECMQHTNLHGSRARKRLSLRDATDNKSVLDLVSGADHMEVTLDISSTSDRFVHTINAHQNETEKDEQLKGRDPKRLRKENGNGDAEGIEMKAAGSLEEYRREQ
jgi:hypothetical protein